MKKQIHDKKLRVTVETLRALDLHEVPVAGGNPSNGALFSCLRPCRISQLGWTCEG